MRLLLAPFSIALGILSGLVAKRIFSVVWGMVDEEEPPSPKDRQVPWVKLLAAGAVQGVVFRLTRIFADRGVRRGVLALTGRWPGEKRPDRA
jgi:Protein of unknown function (DUF4235)